MLNWFLHKIGRTSTPDASEVVQLARVHVARSVLKKHRTTLIPIAEVKAKLGDAYSTSKLAPPPPPPPAGEGGGGNSSGGESSSSSSVLGKRKADGRPVGGLTHVEATNEKQLYENLKNMYPGVQKKAVLDAVDGDAWVYHDEESFSPNPAQLHQWSEANGLWQHFAAYCRNEGIKHDIGLFGGDPDQPKEKSGGGPAIKKVANAVGPPVLMPGQYAGKAGGKQGGGKADGGKKGVDGTTEDGSQGLAPPKRTPYMDDFDATVTVLQNNLRARVEAFASERIPIQYIDCRKYTMDASLLSEWQRRGMEWSTPDLVVLLPYVVLMRRNENGEGGIQGSSTLTTLFGRSGVTPAEVKQLGVYTFKYGLGGFFLHVAVSLVISNRNPRMARFIGKYIMSNPADIMLPCDCGPVSLNRDGTPELPPDDEVEEQGVHYLTGGVAASQDDKYTELWQKSKTQNSIPLLDEVMTATAGAIEGGSSSGDGDSSMAVTSATIV